MEDSQSKPSPSLNPSPETEPQMSPEELQRFSDSWNTQADLHSDPASITWDTRKLASFKRSYARASRGLARPESTFTFQGHEFVLGYAKYLIQYLDSKLGARK